LRLDKDGRPGTCEPHPSPPRQVDRCHRVSVHHYSTLTAPELAFQSLVRLESLPASRTRHTGTSGLTPRQTDNRQSDPARLVFDLSLSFPEAPPVHPTTILSSLTVTLAVESTYAMNVFQNDCCSPLDCQGDDCLGGVMEQMSRPRGPSSPVLRRYTRFCPSIVAFERSDYVHWWC
jgi:hypothetical protein